MNNILRAIVGPTASGKTRLAIEIAKSDDRIILINGDAFAVYMGMEIGTAVPKDDELKDIDFRLLSFVSPEQEYSIAEFQKDCNRELDGIIKSQKIPIIVGGSALYVLSILNGLNVPNSYPEIRVKLETELLESTSGDLYKQLQLLDPVAALKIHPNNSRRIIRALEVCLGSGIKFSDFGSGVANYSTARENDILLVLNPDVNDLKTKIRERLKNQLDDGFMQEVANLSKDFRFLSKTAQKAIGYAELNSVLNQELNLEQAIENIINRTNKFSKRQNKWFKRDDRAIFVDPNIFGLDDIKLLLKL